MDQVWQNVLHRCEVADVKWRSVLVTLNEPQLYKQQSTTWYTSQTDRTGHKFFLTSEMVIIITRFLQWYIVWLLKTVVSDLMIFQLPLNYLWLHSDNPGHLGNAPPCLNLLRTPSSDWDHVELLICQRRWGLFLWPSLHFEPLIFNIEHQTHSNSLLIVLS